MEASTFLPHQHDDILRFFKENGYVVIEDAISEEEVNTLNAFVDRSQREITEEWGVGVEMFGHGQILVGIRNWIAMCNRLAPIRWSRRSWERAFASLSLIFARLPRKRLAVAPWIFIEIDTKSC